jgi:hypothetical protein
MNSTPLLLVLGILETTSALRPDNPDVPGWRRIRETERFQERLTERVQPDAIPEWLDTPNDAFDGLKPIEVIERGEIDRLWSMIFYLESGVAS